MVAKSVLVKKRERIFNQAQNIFDFLKTTKDHEEAAVRFQKLTGIEEKFEKVQEQIIQNNDGVDSEDSIPIDKVDSAFYDFIFNSELLYKKLISENQGMTSSSNASDQLTKSSLPKLRIPVFSGNISEWQTFIELFNSSIHSSPLPDIIKFQHLRSLLQGEALHLIENFPITSANYSSAYTTLQNRYHNNRLLASYYINKLLSYKSVPLSSKENLLSFLSAHKDSVDAFNNLSIKNKSDFLLFQITYTHLDRYLQSSFDSKFNPSDIPSFKDLVDHVESSLKYKELHTAQVQSPQEKVKSYKHPMREAKSFVSSIQSSAVKSSKQVCSLCSSDHFLNSCPSYKEKTPKERHEFVSSNKLCFNCLGPHLMSQCYNKKRCHFCGAKHHSSLHDDDQKASVTPVVSTHTQYYSQNPRNSVLLATALVRLHSNTGEEVRARALLDQGSEVSLISESIVQQLHIRRQRANLPLKGIGAHISGTTNGIVSVELRPHFSSEFCCNLNAYVLPKLTANLPSVPVSSKLLNFNGITLADPSFFQPGKIDILLGADVYGQLLQPELIQTGIDSPTAQRTKIGWILSGSVSSYRKRTPTSAFTSLQCCVDHELHSLIQRFWEQESVENNQPILSPEEEDCERHFIETHRRDSSGRYIVRLPFKRSPEELGESETTAKKSLARIHKKFSSNQTFSDLYSKFMQEYESLGHMIRSSSQSNHISKINCYLPHHGVLRESSTTTKLRVVFNGSSKTSTGVSLNEILHVGAKLQRNIADVIQWWRRYKYVFCTDIEKMFRQIAVASEDQNYQQILWSPNAHEKPQSYFLTTVTYGLTSAPYLANRVIQQLAQDEGNRFPLAVPVIHHGTYVDDLFGGAETVEQTRSVAYQLKGLGTAGGFKLHKWTTNSQEIFGESSDVSTTSEVSFLTAESDTIRTLGIIWQPQSDNFLFKPPIQISQPPYTKRKVLSSIAQLFDPLGWVTPVTIKAKIILQEIWLTKIDWDDILPQRLCSTWIEFLEQLQHLSSLSVPRWIFCSSENKALEIHGFADASESAIAAVIYLKVISGDSSIHVSLLQAKSKVAPLKRMTIPRLELTAALLLVQQTAHTIQILNLNQVPVHLWTDSSVTLTWIQGHPSKWKEFISNRVSKIQEILPSAQWHHVSGKENPADCASRGCFPKQLKDHSLWWNGPDWLLLPKSSWPIEPQKTTDIGDLEERSKTVGLTHCEASIKVWDLISKYSKLNTLLRVTAICRRFLTKRSLQSNPLSSAELYHERQFWVRLTQASHFSSQLKIITQGKSLPKSDPLIKLNPFIDESGLLRVGGRLQNSLLHPDQKHPFILPRHSELTTLIIREAHERTLHGGTQLTLAYIRQTCWIIGGRAPVKSFILHCVRCARFRGTTAKQLMGQPPL